MRTSGSTLHPIRVPKLRSLLLLAVGLCLPLLLGAAGGRLDQIRSRGILRVGTTGDWQQAGAGLFPEVPDLATVIRPRLDALTTRLLRELAMAWPALSDAAQQGRIAATLSQSSGGVGSYESALTAATQPLSEAGAKK